MEITISINLGEQEWCSVVNESRVERPIYSEYFGLLIQRDKLLLARAGQIRLRRAPPPRDSRPEERRCQKVYTFPPGEKDDVIPIFYYSCSQTYKKGM